MSLSVEQILRKARRLAKNGKVDLAVREYETILERFPGNERARDELSAIRETRAGNDKVTDRSYEEQISRLIDSYTRGKLTETLEQGAALAQLHPDEPLLPNLLGAANAGLGRLDQAERSYREALRLKPDYAEACNNLAVVLYELGKFPEAVATCKKALELKSNFAEAFNNLGNILNELGDFREAVANYRKALEINPDYAEAHGNLGNALSNVGDPDAAILSFKRALQINPEYAGAYNNLGNALNDLGKSEEAIATFQTALQLKPDFAAAHNSLGAALKALGKNSEAIVSYERALRIKGDLSEAHLNLSIAKTFRDGDPQIDDMLGLLDRTNLSDKDRARLHFALGKAYDDLHDHDKAFSHLEAGNRLRKTELQYEILSSEMTFSNIKSIFSGHIPSLSARRDGDVSGHPIPIFVLGMPRSGTTLVEQILASHSLVHGAGELEVLSRCIEDIIRKNTNPSIEQLRAIRDAYFRGVGNIGVAEQYVTDKLPLNFLWIGFILTALPEAKIIHVKRDARATCWSNFKHYFSRRGTGFSNDLRDIAQFYVLYADLMEFWHARFPGEIYDLCYESLTEHQESETQRLLQYIGLDLEAQCMHFYETDRSVRTASATQVRQKMYRGSSDAWRKYEKHLGPMLRLLDTSSAPPH